MNTPEAVSPQWDDQLHRLQRHGRVFLPWVADVIQWLVDTHAGGAFEEVADVGAGPGVAAVALAETLPHAHVTALDVNTRFLEHARARAQVHGVADRFATCHGDLEQLDQTALQADLIWAGHVLHHVADPAAALRALGEQLGDRGTLAVAEGGLPLRVLPGNYGVGRPGFASRLDAATSRRMVDQWQLTGAAVDGDRDWPLQLTDAGLTRAHSRTFLLEYPAPIDDEIRQYVIEHFDHVRDLVAGDLDLDDAAALDRLLDPDDPGSLHRRADLFLLTAQTVHTARREP